MTEENFDNLNLKVEAVLFAYGDYVSVTEIKEALKLDSEIAITNSLNELAEKYKEGYSYTMDQNEEGEWRMALRDEYDEIVTALISGTEIPRNVLKVLSVIAYEQPVTKTRLSEIIGRYVKPEVDYLFKAKFVTYDKQGIARYYKVTKKFYDYFKIDNEEDFRKAANKNMNEFLREPSKKEQKILAAKEAEMVSEDDEDRKEEASKSVDEIIEEVTAESEKENQSEEQNPKSKETEGKVEEKPEDDIPLPSKSDDEEEKDENSEEKPKK